MTEIRIEVEERTHPELFKVIMSEPDFVAVTFHGIAFQAAPIHLISERAAGQRKATMIAAIVNYPKEPTHD